MNYDAFFTDLTNDSPFFKAAIEGFAGTGKTTLAAMIAMGIHKRIGSTKPIVVYDTERAFSKIKDEFDKAGIQVKHKKSRSLADLITSFQACEAGYADILLIDSISHVWQSFQNAYLEAKSKRLRKPVTKLAFPDWGYLKPEWKKGFSDWVINSNFHVIFTGRAAYEYDYDQDEETGKMTELKKSGIKMQAEKEAAYEPDILILMETIQDLISDNKSIYRRATILKDRYRIIDGKQFKNPTFKDFEKVVEKLLDGTPSKTPIQETQDDFSKLDVKNEDWQKKRDVILEEIEAIFTSLGLGTSKEDRKVKIDIFEAAFETTSWTAIENKKVTELEPALEKLKQFKVLMLQYMKDCAETSAKPDPAMAYEFIYQIWDKKF